MMELLLAVGVMVLLLSLAWATQLPWDILLLYGQWGVAIGMLTGVPPAVVYHVRLWQELRAAQQPTRGFIWNPIRFHPLVAPHRQSRFLPWFYAGGAGFVVVTLGLVAMGLAVVSVFVRGV
jgi:hypothetical protein